MKTSPGARDCADLAPLLTALFDGEADAEAAAQARAHLLQCQRCARLWLDWNQHRNILQSESAPAAPPTLLWRVLLACRMAQTARPARRRFVPRISSAPGSVAVPVVHLGGLEAPLPSQLSAHILERTTRAPRAHVLLTPTDARPAARPAARRLGARQWSMVAAPVLALWLLLLGRPSFFSAPDPVSTPSRGVAAPGAPGAPAVNTMAAPVRANAKSVASAASTKVSISPVLLISAPVRAVAAPMVARAAVSTRAATPPQSAAVADFGGMISLAMKAAQSHEIRVQTIALEAPSVPVRAPRVLASRAALETRPQTSVEPAPPRAARVPAQRTLKPLSLRVITLASARRAPAVLSGEPSQPRPRVAHLNAPGQPVNPESETALRVSRPAPSRPVLLAVNFGGDNAPRVDDLRSAVDDFRAAISDDAPADE